MLIIDYNNFNKVESQKYHLVWLKSSLYIRIEQNIPVIIKMLTDYPV